MGTRRTITDSLCLRGTARYNLKLWMKLLPEEEINESIPFHFSRHPCFLNHLDLAVINKRATGLGSNRNRHDNLRLCKRNNGEVFLSEYLLAQRQRNDQYPSTKPKPNRCQCTLCAKNPTPLSHEIGNPVCATIGSPHIDDCQVNMADCHAVVGPGIRVLAGLTRENRNRNSLISSPCELLHNPPPAPFLNQESSTIPTVPTPEPIWVPAPHMPPPSVPSQYAPPPPSMPSQYVNPPYVPSQYLYQPPTQFQDNYAFYAILLQQQVATRAAEQDLVPVPTNIPPTFRTAKKRRLFAEACCDGRRVHLESGRTGRVKHTDECTRNLKP
jgi:hypothetical protein